jgi:hypothetical protein
MKIPLKVIEKLMSDRAISAAQLSIELGYRSPNTVYSWFRNKKIPEAAYERIQIYIHKNRKRAA